MSEKRKNGRVATHCQVVVKVLAVDGKPQQDVPPYYCHSADLSADGIRLVLGANWEPAVPYVQIIAFGWMFDFAAIPFSNAVLLLGIQRQHFIIDMMLRILVLAGLGVGCLQDNLLLGCALAAGVRAVVGTGFGIYLMMRSLQPARTGFADALN